MASSPIFQRIVQLCGLPEVLGCGIVRRALADVGATPETAELVPWRRALPPLQKRLNAYVREDEAALLRQRVEALLDRVEAGRLTPDPDCAGSRPPAASARSFESVTPNPD